MSVLMLAWAKTTTVLHFGSVKHLGDKCSNTISILTRKSNVPELQGSRC
jgi:hypothetical protein